MKNSSYQRTNHSKHHLKCHLIFVCKYRKKLLVSPIDDFVKATFIAVAKESDFDIEVMETDKDHIHFLIRYIPRLSVSSIVRHLKQKSTIEVWRLFKSALNEYFWRENTFWSDGYFVCSIGEANPDTIKNYILSQG
jgi:putative transposase